MTKTMTKGSTFAEKMEALKVKAGKKGKERQALEEKARMKKKEEDTLLQEIQYMNRIQAMSNYEKPASMNWEIEDWDTKYRNEYAWKKAHKLRTAQIDVLITLAERTDMKKFKYEVRVSGHKETFPTSSYTSGYNDHEAVKKLTHTWMNIPNSTRWDYVQNEGAPDMVKKFASLTEAEEFVAEWKGIINKGFAQEIKQDRHLLRLAKMAK